MTNLNPTRPVRSIRLIPIAADPKEVEKDVKSLTVKSLTDRDLSVVLVTALRKTWNRGNLLHDLSELARRGPDGTLTPKQLTDLRAFVTPLLQAEVAGRMYLREEGDEPQDS